jgi:hypothetical protein
MTKLSMVRTTTLMVTGSTIGCLLIQRLRVDEEGLSYKPATAKKDISSVNVLHRHP